MQLLQKWQKQAGAPLAYYVFSLLLAEGTDLTSERVPERRNGTWNSWRFHGTRWQQVNTAEGRLYLKNAYRVILTRARQGMIVYVPKGADEDPTRPPAYYDQTYEFLKQCGLRELA